MYLMNFIQDQCRGEENDILELSRNKEERAQEWRWLLGPGQDTSGLSVPSSHLGTSASTSVFNSEAIVSQSLGLTVTKVQSTEPASSHSAPGSVWTSGDIHILLVSCHQRFSSGFHLDWVRWLLFTHHLLCPDWVCPSEKEKVRKL